jgi:hypothetical protein
MVRLLRLYATIASAIFEVTAASSNSGTNWLDTVGLCASIENVIFEAGTYFVKIAADINVTQNKEHLNRANDAFDTAIKGLEGFGEYSTDDVAKVEVVANLWGNYSKMIFDNVDSITSRPVEEKQKTLLEIDERKEYLLQKANELTTKTVHMSIERGGPKTVTVLTYAVKQTMCISSLTNDLILVSLGIDKKENISFTIKDFDDRHSALLEGDSLNDIPMMSDVCKLLRMREVGYLWINFKAGLTAVLDTASSKSHADRAKTLMATGLEDANALLTEMKMVRNLIIKDNDDCDPADGISKQQWWVLTQRTGLQRVLSQKSVRLFTNIASKVLVSENKVELVMALDEAETNLKDLLFGSKIDDVPSPISHEVAKWMAHSKSLWDQMSTDLRSVVSQDGYDKATLTKCSRLSDPLLLSLNNVMDFLVASAASRVPSLQAEVIDVSGAQLVKICKLCKESMLADLDVDREKNTGQMVDSVKMWRDAHTTLLRGGIPPSNVSTGVNKTTDVCLLQQMQKALDVHKRLEISANILVEYGNNSAELHQLNLLAYTEMFDAVTMYGQLVEITCTLNENSVVDFKSFLYAVGKLRMLLQRVQKEFLSTDVGLNTTINAISSSFEQLIFGESSIRIKAAPTQAIADALFNMETLWLELKSALVTSTAIVTQESLSSGKNGVDAVMTSNKIAAIMEAYVTLAEEQVSATELNPKRVDIASRQCMLVEQMAKEAILVGESSTSDQQLRSTIAAYEAAHNDLMDQTHSGRNDIIENMEKAEVAWQRYKVQVLDVASGSRAAEMQTQLDLLSPILAGNIALYAMVVEKPVRAQRSSFLLLRVLIPLALVLGPSLLGFIRGFFAKE